MKGNHVPLIDAIKEYQNKSKASFHVPGHKNGLYFHESLFQDFRHVLPYDLTELEGLDDLHAPVAAIKEAQQATADLYGAKETFFLVGGTTVGNLAMVYALFQPGDVVFIQRNSHKSIFNAAQVAGIIPILLEPAYDLESGHPLGLTSETLKKAISMYPEAKGVLLTYPNYYGVSLNVQTVIEEAKRSRLLVLVDEAHAAHYVLGEPFPKSTLILGADVVVQSAHKMLPALTMSSFLHVGSGLSSDQINSIRDALMMFQSSSPSYLLMASLDGARAYAESLNYNKIHHILAGIDRLKQELATINQIEIVDWDKQGYHFDPLKVTIRTATALTGFELQQFFNKVGLYPELADENHILLVFGLGTIPRLSDAIVELKKMLLSYQVITVEKRTFLPAWGNDISQLHIFPNQMRFLEKKEVPLTEACGLVAAESIVPYPPGIPLVLKGERICVETLMKIQQLKEAGARFQGHEDGLDRVWVVDLEEM
ncbi:aminotransferase class V-fold PLP-dependent enzyme [bacterium LRH843]|nr:aminotransferase class V-fold PLP-dependent enzyme [bacterium LRH843]